MDKQSNTEISAKPNLAHNAASMDVHTTVSSLPPAADSIVWCLSDGLIHEQLLPAQDCRGRSTTINDVFLQFFVLRLRGIIMIGTYRSNDLEIAWIV